MGLKEFCLHLIRQYGNTGLFAALALEFIGFPLPGETAMVFVGFQTWKGVMNIVQAITSAIAGSFSGSMAAYLAGRFLGRNFLEKYGKYVHIDTIKLGNVERWFVKYEVHLYLFGRFIPGVRHLVPYVAGVTIRNAIYYNTYNLLGSGLWCIVFIAAGRLLGKHWEAILPHINRISLAALAALVVCATAYGIYLKRAGMKDSKKNDR